MKKIGIICRDAGAAFFLSNFCKNNKSKYIFSLKRPAIKIFKQEIGLIKNYSLKEILKNSFCIISGTGKTDYEKKNINYFIKNNKKVIAYVDHWANFLYRFTLNDKLIEPDEIWVSDKKTFKLSKIIFKKKITRLKKLKIFNKKIKKIKKIKNNKINILYLMGLLNNKKKMISLLEKKTQQSEFKSFKNFLKFVKEKKIHLKEKFSIQIRIHPEERDQKYIYQKIKKFKFFKISKNRLLDDLKNSDLIFGGNSAAMLIAKKINKKIIICLNENRDILNKTFCTVKIKNFKFNEN